MTGLSEDLRKPGGVLYEADYASPPQESLPPDRYRSLDGVFNYAGWSEQQRFIELDHEIRSQAQEQNGEHSASDEPEVPPASRRCSAWLPGGSLCRNRFNLNAEYVGS